MSAMVRATLKIVVRMKSFWFFLLITPILSTVILGTRQSNLSYYENSAIGSISELEKPEDKVAYYGGKGKCVIKVYDAAGSDLSGYLLDKITDSGLFQICRVDITGMDRSSFDTFVTERLKEDGDNDRMGAALYILPDFDRQVTGLNNAADSGTDSPLKMYILSDDGRVDILKSEIDTVLSRFKTALEITKAPTSEELLSVLGNFDKSIPEKQVVKFSTSNKNNLTNEQIDQRTRMGYAMAILTLGYVFCGLFVAHVAINEQKDSVFTRIKLSGMGMFGYFISKVITVVFVTLMVTGVMGACSLFLDVEAMGMSRLEFLMIMFLMGLIFSTLSMLLGILIGDVMSSNVAAFTLWSMSALLSGLYFPLNYTTDVLKAISYMLPHKWFLDGTEMILVGDKMGPVMLLCVTVAYMILIGSFGSLGLKIKRVEEWGSV